MASGHSELDAEAEELPTIGPLGESSGNAGASQSRGVLDAGVSSAVVLSFFLKLVRRRDFTVQWA